MKNTKAIFLIIIGAFILATGFAFAENVAYEQLKEQASGIEIPAPITAGATRESILAETPTRAAAVTAVPTPPAAPAAVVAKTPTLGEQVKKFLGDNFSSIFSAVVIGLLAFLVIGTGGAALLAGVGAFAFFTLLGKL